MSYATLRDVLNIDPTKIKIKGKEWDDDNVVALFSRENQMRGQVAHYWKPLMDRGRRLENTYEGKILTNTQRDYYEGVEGKVVLETPIAKPPVRALVGQVIRSRRSGQVITERGSEGADNTEEITVLNAVMKYMENKTREEYLIADAIASSFVSCYWNVLYYEKCRPDRDPDGMGFKMYHLPWSSCMFGPATIREPDGSDIREMFYMDYRTIADLIDNYPDMERQITEHFRAGEYKDSKMYSSISQWDNVLTSEERSVMYDVQNAYESRGISDGRVKTIMHLYPVKKKESVYINLEDDDDIVILSPSWSEERRESWLAENLMDNGRGGKYAGPYERESVVLWQTVYTMSGLVLSNEAHWFQENGKLPCSFWLGEVSGGQPTGIMADIVDDVLSNCVANIEALDDIRKGSGRTVVARAGAIQADCLESLTSELNKSISAVILDKDFRGSIGDAIQEWRRQPNRDWEAFADRQKNSMIEVSRVSEAMMGGHAPRQSAIAKETEVSLGLAVWARAIDNVNRSWDYHQNLKLMLIPYFFNAQMTIEILDEDSGEVKPIELNAPTAYDIHGNVSAVVNNLSSGHKYRWVPNPVDDSPIAKHRNMEELLNVINASAGPLMSADPSGASFAEFLLSSSNPVMMKMGKRMMERAEQSSQAQAEAQQAQTQLDAIVKLGKLKADLERAAKHGVLLNGRFDDFANYPQLAELFGQMQANADANADANFAEVVQGAQQLVNPEQPDQPEQGGMPEEGMPEESLQNNQP